MSKKAQQLGMPAGTANGRLRKLIMFDLVQRLGEDICHRCREQIEAVDELSVEHKQPWLDVDVSLFWDLSNIAFSHLSCNISASRQGRSPGNIKFNQGEVGTLWCGRCQEFYPEDCFYRDRSTSSGRSRVCKMCHDIGTGRKVQNDHQDRVE